MADNNKTLLSVTESPTPGGKKQFDIASVLDARQAAFGGIRSDELLNILGNRARLAQQQDFETQRILGAIAKIGFSAVTGNPLGAISGGADLLGGNAVPDASTVFGSGGRSEPTFFEGITSDQNVDMMLQVGRNNLGGNIFRAEPDLIQGLTPGQGSDFFGGLVGGTR